MPLSGREIFVHARYTNKCLVFGTHVGACRSLNLHDLSREKGTARRVESNLM